MNSEFESSQLHIYNIANVAYGYCKIINGSLGNVATLVCHDTNHIMSQPEWDDQDLNPKDFPDEGNFFESTKMICYTRPTWYSREDIVFSSSKLLPLAAKRIPESFKKTILPFFLQIRKFIAKIETLASIDQFDKLHSLSVEAQIFRPHVDWLRRHSKSKKICFAYATAAIYCYLYHDRPYVAVEIGTMREIPFEATIRGELLSAAYKEADYVIITNPDVVCQAQKLGLSKYAFCPHPVDENKFFPRYDSEIKKSLLLNLPESDLIGIAPARQNWEIKGNDKYITALHILRNILKVKVSLVIPLWGQDICKTQDLAKKYRVYDYILWVAPLPEAELIKYYSTLDFVLDQFNLGVFGLITPKALACNAAVITSYDEKIHQWCFAEHPPLLRAFTTEEIVTKIMEVKAKGPEWQLSKNSRDWFLRFHSKKVVLEILRRVTRMAGENFQKKNENITSKWSPFWKFGRNRNE